MLYLVLFSSRRRHTKSLCDWSSDVCSSDLFWPGRIARPNLQRFAAVGDSGEQFVRAKSAAIFPNSGDKFGVGNRSEERRVGKECRGRWVRDKLTDRQMDRNRPDAVTSETTR